MVWISNGWASGFQIPFEIGTIFNPTSFWPFKIQTSSDFNPHCKAICLGGVHLFYFFLFRPWSFIFLFFLFQALFSLREMRKIRLVWISSWTRPRGLLEQTREATMMTGNSHLRTLLNNGPNTVLRKSTFYLVEERFELPCNDHHWDVKTCK